jgi:uncharacterized membrane protein
MRDPKLIAALSYALGLPGALVVLWAEKQDTYVRFHAIQSCLVFTIVALLSMLLPTVPVFGDWRIFRGMFLFSVVAVWGFLMVKALQGEAYRLPYVGDLAATYSSTAGK